MQDDPKEEKPSFRFVDYISLLLSAKVNLEDREHLRKLSERMREFTEKFATIKMTSERGRPQLTTYNVMNHIRNTGKPLLLMRLLKDGLSEADVQMFGGLKTLHEDVDDASLIPHRSKGAITLAGDQASSTYTLSHLFELTDVSPRSERRSPSVLKQGRKQVQKRRLAEATDTKSNQRTSGLLNSLLNSLSATSKDTK